MVRAVNEVQAVVEMGSKLGSCSKRKLIKVQTNGSDSR